VTPATDTLSVVICAYTEARWADLSAAIESVRIQERPAHEIVLVIDHNDALLERARAAFTDVTVVANAEAQGLSGARNTGIATSTGTIVAFLDDDAAARPGWTRRLMAPYADPRVLGVGGRVVPRFEAGRPTWLPPEFDWVVGCTYVGHRATPGPVRNLIGANMSVRRSVIDEIGGFRHSLGRTASLPAGCEETELFIRAGQHDPDGLIWYEPAAAVDHNVPASRTTREYFRSRCFAEGISKTQIARLVGTQDGLASERAYTTRALPRAIVRDLARSVRSGDRAGVARAGTVVRGIATTATGYLAARVPGAAPKLVARAERKAQVPPPTETVYEPALVTQVELTEGTRALSDLDPLTGATFGRAVVLVRRHGNPIGVVEVPLGAGGTSAPALATELSRRLGVEVPIAPDPAVMPGAPLLPGTPNGNGNGNGATNGNGNGSPVTSVRERAAAAVVIATRDRVDSLGRCLESLRELDYPAREIVVVDNASSGRDTAELVHALHNTDPRFVYVREDRPGLARAHNPGIAPIAAPVVAFTDDDVVVDHGWLRALVDGFDRRPNVGCVTGMIFPLELETEAQDWLERYAGFNKGFEPVVFDLTDGSTDPLFPYTAGSFGSGANMAFRTDVLRGMRGFEPALGAGTEAKGGDDLAAFFDVIAAGYAIAYEPAAIVYHEHHRTFDALRRQTFGYGVGLSAYLTKTVLDDPDRVWDMLSRAPKALHHALSPKSAKNDRLPLDTPRTLVRRERFGMLVGPALYLLSRADARHDARPGPATAVVALDDDPGVAVDLPALELHEASGA
jgi:GT2 family glycosyltransferase